MNLRIYVGIVVNRKSIVQGNPQFNGIYYIQFVQILQNVTVSPQNQEFSCQKETLNCPLQNVSSATTSQLHKKCGVDCKWQTTDEKVHF